MKRRDETASVLPLIIGFAAILMLAIGVAVDASAAYLHKQGLSTLADDAALAGANGVTEESLYAGIPGDRLDQEVAAARVAVADYLRKVGAAAKYPGLRMSVSISPDGTEVQVRLAAALPLPLAIPGGPAAPTITADGSASGIVTG